MMPEWFALALFRPRVRMVRERAFHRVHRQKRYAAAEAGVRQSVVTGLMQKSLGIGLYTVEAHYEFRI